MLRVQSIFPALSSVVAQGQIAARELHQSAASSSSWFSHVTEAPKDPILGVTEKFIADKNPDKINLGVGAYRDDDGRPVVLPSVREAERRVAGSHFMEYLPIGGLRDFNIESVKLAYGDDADVLRHGQVAAVQSLSGTGSCRLFAEFQARFMPGSKIYIPVPTWSNHHNIWRDAKVQEATYRYYHPATRGIDMDGLLEDIKTAPKGSVFLLHACAHNPTGVDPSPEQWKSISKLMLECGQFPFFDMAYQGFASGDTDRDAQAIRIFLADGHRMGVSQSYAKNMGLYGQRVGCLSIICDSPKEASAIESQVKAVARPTYSNPPLHGALLVAKILHDKDLKSQWKTEVKGMADRIILMRSLLRKNLEAEQYDARKTPGGEKAWTWGHITDQIGMFAYSGMTGEMVDRLASEFSIYMTRNGRISMAGVNSKNVLALARAIHAVTRGRTELGEQGVVLIERLETESKKDHHELKAMLFVRPTRDNITLLKKELKTPRFGSYNIYFTNLATPIFLQDLAEADAVKEHVVEVHEFYGDYIVIDGHHFTIPLPKNELLLSPKVALPDQIDRLVQGLSSVFLSIRRRPVIRFQRGSENTQRLAEGLYRLTYKEQYSVFDFGSRSNPIVLILDRKDDPVTPLLTQWTYQAMIHELIGLNDGTARLKSAKLTDEESRNIVLDPSQDDFYRKHVFANYGEVGVDVKSLLDQFASKNEKHKQVESLEDMKRFISEHIDFTRLQGNVTKHVNIMSEVAEAISKRGLMEISMAEQELANPEANLAASASYEEIMQLLRQPGTNDKDKIRLVMLYSLRFETEIVRIQALMDFLSTTSGVKERSPRLFAALEAVLMHAGGTKRAGDLYATRSALSRARSVFRGLKGVENVYTQHTPLLSATLSMISLDRLDPSSYPYMAGSQDETLNLQAAFKRTPPREVIVFIVGGSTYEESKCVHDWNERNPHMRVVLGGSAVLNSDMFLAGLAGFEHKDESEELL